MPSEARQKRDIVCVSEHATSVARENGGVSRNLRTELDSRFRSAGSVCSTWRELARSPTLWRSLCLARWSFVDQHYYQNNWFHVYRSSNRETKHLSHRWEIPNFSDLQDEKIFSEPFSVSNTTWYDEWPRHHRTNDRHMMSSRERETFTLLGLVHAHTCRKLMMFPRGNGNYAPRYLSAYLAVSCPPEQQASDDWSIDAVFSITIVNPINPHLSVTRGTRASKCLSLALSLSRTRYLRWLHYTHLTNTTLMNYDGRLYDHR